jgi:prevent-host-death family protein
MDDQVYNIAEAKMHFSKLIDRVEEGERITIARNNRPAAFISSAEATPQGTLARIDAVRERIRRENRGRCILKRGETFRDLIEEGRRVS